jgi:glutamate-1-semialdehyde aminotransferase
MTEQVFLALLGEGFLLTPELAGALSTPMSEVDVDQLVGAADRVFARPSVTDGPS